MPLVEFETGVKPGDDSVVLWRYLEFERFQSLLEHKALFFCRADRFADPFEGSLPRLEDEHRYVSQRQTDSLYGLVKSEEEVRLSVAKLASFHHMMRCSHVVNCWQAKATESVAMWELYMKSNDGVAIQTTIGDLKCAFHNNTKKICISGVRYLDYERGSFYHRQEYPIDTYNVFSPLVHKRVEYVHESEIRLIHNTDFKPEDWSRKTHPFDTGIFLELEVNTLIKKVILHPTSDESTLKKLEAIASKNGFKFAFEKSSLTKMPRF
jgi:hypothetical protein